jgi:hypothetical protein
MREKNENCKQKEKKFQKHHMPKRKEKKRKEN